MAGDDSAEEGLPKVEETSLEESSNSKEAESGSTQLSDDTAADTTQDAEPSFEEWRCEMDGRMDKLEQLLQAKTEECNQLRASVVNATRRLNELEIKKESLREAAADKPAQQPVSRPTRSSRPASARTVTATKSASQITPRAAAAPDAQAVSAT